MQITATVQSGCYHNTKNEKKSEMDLIYIEFERR